MLIRCHKESQHPAEWAVGLRLNIRRTRKTQRDGHNSGVKIWCLCSVSSTLSHANLEQPFRTLAIKWEVNIFLKKSSCVFLPASLSCVVYSCVCLWYCVVVMLNDDVDDDITIIIFVITSLSLDVFKRHKNFLSLRVFGLLSSSLL